MITKVSMGMFPTVRQLMAMGVKPGSGVSLLNFLRGAEKQTTPGIKRILPEFARTMKRGPFNPSLREAPFALPPIVPGRWREMPHPADVLRQRAQMAGTYQKLSADFSEEVQALPEHHFRNLGLALGPAAGAIGGGIDPLLRTFNERIEAGFKHDVPKFTGLFKNYPWGRVLPGAAKGILPGALSGLVSGMLLDAYLQKKLYPRELPPS